MTRSVLRVNRLLWLSVSIVGLAGIPVLGDPQSLCTVTPGGHVVEDRRDPLARGLIAERDSHGTLLIFVASRASRSSSST